MSGRILASTNVSSEAEFQLIKSENGSHRPEHHTRVKQKQMWVFRAQAADTLAVDWSGAGQKDVFAS